MNVVISPLGGWKVAPGHRTEAVCRRYPSCSCVSWLILCWWRLHLWQQFMTRLAH